MLDQPHHDPSERWVSDPTPDPGEIVTLTLEVPRGAGVDDVQLRTMHDMENVWYEGELDVGASTEDLDVWRVDMACPNQVNTYRFWLGGPGGPRWLTGLGVLDHDPVDAFDFRLLTGGGAPRWVPETVWYQIFPDRFAASGSEHCDLPDWAWRSEWGDPVATGPEAMSQIYGGDLDGIAQRLDHLVDLGVGGIYLTPVFPARSNHRYDATSFDHVDPLLGGDEAWVRLRQACDRSGLRLITDLTPNHTGVGHEWFRRAQTDAQSVEAGFYYFDDHPDDYAAWLGIPTLPKLNHSSAEMRRRLYEGPESVVARFLQPPLSADGWRFDVANMTGRLGTIDQNAMVRQMIRATCADIDPERWLVAEHFFDASLDATGDGWHGVMNYAGVAKPIASWLGNFSFLTSMAPGPGQDPRGGRSVARTIDEVRSALAWQIVLGSMALLGSHDTARWHSMARTDADARLGFGLLLAMPGSPCFFYGDEVGLTAVDNEQARRPMPWDRTDWDLSMYEWYRSLVRFRASSAALAHGGFRWVERSDDALMFLRESSDDRVLVRADRAPTGPATSPLGGDQVAGDGEYFTIWQL